MSCSDYFIFKKLNISRAEAMKKYLSIAEEALSNGIVPRCHLEDITRADFYGFVIPLVRALMELSRQAKMRIKIRSCDNLELGIAYSGAALPRSIQKIIHGLRQYGEVPSEWLEWHGHNDFYVGSEFSATRAGIHADGVLKDEEIYNIFDTEKILNRPGDFKLTSMFSALIIQKILPIPETSMLINFLNLSKKLMNLCGFARVPDASQFTRFRHKFGEYLNLMFQELVKTTEPICKEISLT